MKHGFFFNITIFLIQKYVLRMGSPRSGILAYLFLEFLESGLFKFIIFKVFNYFSYTDDMVLIYSWNNDFKILRIN